MAYRSRYSRASSRPQQGHRVFKGIGARAVAVDDAKLLLAVPLWPGECVKWARVDVRASCVNQDEGRAVDINFRGLVVNAGDLSVAGLNYGSDGVISSDALGMSGSSVGPDRLYAKMVKSQEDADDLVYGGDYTEHATHDEAWPSLADQALQRQGSGIRSWFRRENWMYKTGAGDYEDHFVAQVKKPLYIRRPSFLLFGAHRWDLGQTEDWNWEEVNRITEPDGAFTFGTQIWNTESVNHLLREVGQYQHDATFTHSLRVLVSLLKGDNYIESGQIATGSASVQVKYMVGIDTPIVAPVLGNA